MTVHYNVPGKERKNLAQAIGAWLEEDAKYAGVPSCAYRIGNFTIDKDGNLSAEGVSEDTIERLIEHLYDEGFESDISADTAEPDEKADNEAQSLGISMPRTLFTDTQLDNIRKLAAAKAGLIKKAMGTDELLILDNGETVSFPWWHNDIGPEEVHAFSTFICKLKETAGELKRVTSKETEPDNEKYAFRCFLLKLGFIGDEYKADRKVLLKNFEGSSAFKSGHKREALPEAISDAEPEALSTEAPNLAQEGGNSDVE